MFACSGSSFSDVATLDGGPQTPVDPGPPPIGGVPIDGIFVASHATSGGNGTVENPVRTLKEGIVLAEAAGKAVLACAESYRETIELADGISVYGYYDCSASPWKRGTSHATVIAPASPAVTSKGLTLDTRFEGFDVSAPDFDGAPATDESGTSIALFVQDTKSLAVSESIFHAGKGAPGIDGVDGASQVEASTSTSGGVGRAGDLACGKLDPSCAGNTISGAGGGTSSCAVVSGYPGGAGGSGAAQGGLSGFGTPTAGLPAVASAKSSVGTGAENTVNGPVGLQGKLGPSGTWTLTVDGFLRGNGTRGENGAPGGGGGGSGGGAVSFDPIAHRLLHDPTAGGSGGGAGGCPGLAGTAGTGGGASIAALVVSSGVVFSTSHLTASEGGAAGKGTAGSAGLGGGEGGRAPANGGYFASDGGAGGDAGLSGHGAPGPSIALAYQGARPTLKNTNATARPGGRGAPSLTRGAQTLPAVMGESKSELAF